MGLLVRVGVGVRLPENRLKLVVEGSKLIENGQEYKLGDA